MHLGKFIRAQSSTAISCLAVVMLLLIGAVDYFTGYEVTLAYCYAVPILLTVYRCSSWTAMLTGTTAGLIWCGADFASGHRYSSSTACLADVMIQFTFFMLLVGVGLAVKRYTEAAGERIALLEENRRLEHEIVQISEYERERIGQELHDGLCQFIAAIRCSAAALRHDLEDAGQPKFAEAARDVTDLLQTAVGQAHDLARGLVPVQLGAGGLPAALEELASSTTRLLGVPCDFSPAGDPAAAGDDPKMRHLYRIAQEAVNNAAKHARARRINVALTSNSVATVLSVTDDGVGISNTPRHRQGLGMSIMKYRSSVIGGELLVEEPVRGGTVISCAMSVQPEEACTAGP